MKGEGQHPLYQMLTGSQFAGDIEWNFAKFLLNRKGEIVARIPPGTEPLAPDVIGQVETLLAE